MAFRAARELGEHAERGVVTRPFDILLVGATGFTGRRVAAELARAGKGLRWAVCGRRAEALEEVVRATRASPCPASGSRVVDLHDTAALQAACGEARLVLSCVGPFATLGEHVVAACVHARTDVMDIAGEPAFMQRVLSTWDAPAAEAGVTVIHACGFDAMIADLGWLRLVERAQALGHEVTSVASFLELSTGPAGMTFHATTLDALATGLSGPRGQPLPRVPRPPGPSPLRRRPFRDATLQRWCTVLPSADAAVVRISQARLARSGGAPQPRYLAYFAFERARSIGASVAVGAGVLALCRSGWGRRVLHHRPRLVTLGHASWEGPTEDQLAHTRFRMTLRAHTADRASPVATAVIEGPEPGYVSTPILLVSAARHWLDTPRDQRAVGVHTPATALAHAPVLATAARHRLTLTHLEG